MSASPQLSRRAFARMLGIGTGVAAVATFSPIAARGMEEHSASPIPFPAASPKRLPRDPENLILLNSNENPYGPSEAAREAMVEGFDIACRYPDFYIAHLEEMLAQFHGFAPENIVVSAGSTELLRMCAMAFLGPGKRLVQATPTFEALESGARRVGAEVVSIPLDSDYRHDLDAMTEAAQERPGVVYICNPNNPTGTVMSKKAIERLIDRVPSQTVVLVDEAYHHFVEDPGYGSLLDAVASGRNIIIARTFSKIYGMAGLRVGYGVASTGLMGQLRPQRVRSAANALGCVAAIASLEDEPFAELNRERNQTARDALYRAMSERGHGTIRSHTNFVCVDVKGPVRPVIDAFREKGIRVGRPFNGLPNHIRISLGLPDEMAKMMTAFDSIFSADTAS